MRMPYGVQLIPSALLNGHSLPYMLRVQTVRSAAKTM